MADDYNEECGYDDDDDDGDDDDDDDDHNDKTDMESLAREGIGGWLQTVGTVW